MALELYTKYQECVRVDYGIKERTAGTPHAMPTMYHKPNKPMPPATGQLGVFRHAVYGCGARALYTIYSVQYMILVQKSSRCMITMRALVLLWRTNAHIVRTRCLFVGCCRPMHGLRATGV